MKLNSKIKLLGSKVILVPYYEHHVPKYHNWMKSEELQKLTASEPLTLEQEYQMQKTWREDEDKCTFIILDKNLYENGEKEVGRYKLQTFQEIYAMIGDTNIFITDQGLKIGEIEIMIAEESARGKKIGWEAVIIMLLYGIQHIKLLKYEAKISLSNIISINIFKKLGFEEQSRSEVFQEVTLIRNVTDEWTDWLYKQYPYEIQNID